MKYERRSSHTIYDHKHHICWVTKYRYRILTGAVAERLRDLVRQICREHQVEIIQGHVRPEHIHLVVSIPSDLRNKKFYIPSSSLQPLLRRKES